MTSSTRFCFSMIFLTSLGACSISSSSSETGPGIDPGLTPESEVVQLRSDGTMPDQGYAAGSSRVSRMRTTNGRTTGFQYQYGRVAGTDRYRGVAGFAPDSDVGGTPTVATASYTGDYDLTYVGNDINRERGRITLEADFNASTLEGEAGGLRVDGTIAGQTVGGSASYRGVTADMKGLIGSDRVVAGFAGDGPRSVLVGGINAERVRNP